MNKFYDKNLDNKGANQLNNIISTHKDNLISDKDAVNKVDKLIKKYPKSPQLLISKAIFSTKLSKYHIIYSRIPLCKKAIKLDFGFFDSYRRLAKANIAKAWSLNLPSPAYDRVQLIAKTDLLSRIIQENNIVKLREFLLNNPNLFNENYENIFENSISILEEGLEKIDKKRYPNTLLENFKEEYNNFIQSSKNETEMKLFIFIVSHSIT
ncbi:MAG: hypothetical protein ACQEQF_05870 [Bacillota bacterium]